MINTQCSMFKWIEKFTDKAAKKLIRQMKLK